MSRLSQSTSGSRRFVSETTFYSPGLLSLKVVRADIKLLKHIELMLEYLIVQCKLSLKVVRVRRFKSFETLRTHVKLP